MSDEKIENLAIVVAPKTDSRLLSWSQLAVSVFAICVTIGGSLISGVSAIRTEIQLVKEQNQIEELRLSNIERKNEGYDHLIEKRNEQWSRIETDMATIKESLAAMNREQAIDRERKGR